MSQENKLSGEKVRGLVLKFYDVNGDGTLDEVERSVVLKAFVTNGNGRLDRKEKVALANAMNSSQEPQDHSDSGGPVGNATSSKWDSVGFQVVSSRPTPWAVASLRFFQLDCFGYVSGICLDGTIQHAWHGSCFSTQTSRPRKAQPD